MSPNTQFRPEKPLDSPIVERLITDPAIVYEVGEDTLVIAARSELLVQREARLSATGFDVALSEVARPVGTLASIAAGRPLRPGPTAGEPPAGDPGVPDAGPPDAGPPDGGSPAGEVEVWRLTDPSRNAIDETRRLRRLAPEIAARSRSGQELRLPAVSPNHLSIVSGHVAGCPAGPPQPTPPPHDSERFVTACEGEGTARVVVIDTGYIPDDPPHVALDERVTVVAGEHLDSHADPAAWVPDPPDAMTLDPEGRLDEISGHGTFIAGLIAHLCPAATLTVVGQRDEDITITGLRAPEQKRLFSSEAALAHALLTHADADVIALGFSFPTLDDYPSLPFALVMQELSGPGAPRPGVAVVTPAGNEDSARPYWPAALPGVIGVGATDRRGRHRADFSNWGPWLDCCARGEDVVSTYLHWSGPVRADPLHEIETFVGWARWDGTSFAAPKVAAAIARLVAAGEDDLEPVAAFARLVSGSGGVRVSEVTDYTLSGLPGVTLPQLHVH